MVPSGTGGSCGAVSPGATGDPITYGCLPSLPLVPGEKGDDQLPSAEMRSRWAGSERTKLVCTCSRRGGAAGRVQHEACPAQ